MRSVRTNIDLELEILVKELEFRGLSIEFDRKKCQEVVLKICQEKRLDHLVDEMTLMDVDANNPDEFGSALLFAMHQDDFGEYDPRCFDEWSLDVCCSGSEL